ncbi:MAG TPA: hypothetical protein VEQ58_16840 [Polyangiaceae bacterium]|nr:hypothetical protein [Polyangiaceae bacterium]
MLFSLLGACGAPGRPVGLPAPEYEEPKVEAWPPASAQPAKSPEAAPPSASETEQGVTPAPEEPAGPPGNVGGSATLGAGSP